MTYSAGNQPGNFSNIIRLIWNEFRKIALSFIGIDSSATSTAVTIDLSGNVGIGVTPTATLHVDAGATGLNALKLDANLGQQASLALRKDDTRDATHNEWIMSSDASNNFIIYGYDGTTYKTVIKSDWTNNITQFFKGGSTTEAMRIDSPGNIVIGTAALSTTATDGFLYIPTCAGTPTGTPTTYTGRAPMVLDTTNNKLYLYNGGWKGVTIA